MATNKGNAPMGFTMTSMAVKDSTYWANVSIYPNHYRCKVWFIRRCRLVEYITAANVQSLNILSSEMICISKTWFASAHFSCNQNNTPGKIDSNATVIKA